MKVSEDEMVDARLEDHVRVVQRTHVSVPQIGSGLPLELMKGEHPGDLKILFHGTDGVGRLAEVTVADFRLGLEQIEVMD